MALFAEPRDQCVPRKQVVIWRSIKYASRKHHLTTPCVHAHGRIAHGDIDIIPASDEVAMNFTAMPEQRELPTSS